VTTTRRFLFLFAAGLLSALARAESAAPPDSSSSPFPPPASRLARIEGRVALPQATVLPRHGQPYELLIEPDLVRTNPPLAIVYLEGDFPPAAPAASDSATSSAAPVARIVQRDLAFVPCLLPVRTGTRVEFPNEDPTYHNVFSFSPAKRFDLGRYRADETPPPSQLFDRPGLVTLRCDIHKHMRAAILVLDTPHFVVTDPEGNFQLPALPPGRYTLKAWIDSRTTRALPVEIASRQTLRVELP
jgi:plastocyanin